MSVLQKLARSSTERFAVHASADAIRHLRRGHPWLWRDSIVRIKNEGNTGDLAVVFDERRNFCGIGLWDQHGPLAVRMLHAGAPMTVDTDFFASKVIDAVAKRASFESNPQTTAWRVIHGENDGLPGLVVDRYEATLVVRLDTAAWLPQLPHLVPTLVELCDATRVVLRCSRRITAHLPVGVSDGMTLHGRAPAGPVSFCENGLAFTADVVNGQKTGYFLDQRDNRIIAASRCNNASVLDVFCNSGGFTVHAAQGGARSVHSVDLSPHAIAATERHAELNRNSYPRATRFTVQTADAFDALKQLAHDGQTFDVVIIDPPSFAPRQSAVEAALRAYRRLTVAGLHVLHDGGVLIQASCSSRIGHAEFRDTVISAVRSQGRSIGDVVETGHAPDHPVSFAEGAYLKAIFGRVG